MLEFGDFSFFVYGFLFIVINKFFNKFLLDLMFVYFFEFLVVCEICIFWELYGILKFVVVVVLDQVDKCYNYIKIRLVFLERLSLIYFYIYLFVFFKQEGEVKNLYFIFYERR